MRAPLSAVLLNVACGLSHRGIFDTLISSQGADMALQRTSEGWYSAELDLGGSAPARLAVDTGSSLLWARGKNSPPAANASNSWAAVLPRHFSVQYGRGHVAGEVVDARVRLIRDPRTTRCAVGRATDTDGIWSKQKTIDGVLGLGCGEGAETNDALKCLLPAATGKRESDGMEALRNSLGMYDDSVPAPTFDRVFALQLRPDGGRLSLGFVPAEYRSSLVFMPSNNHCGHWGLPLLALSASTDFAGPARDLLGGPAEAILDSGSDGIVGPTFAVISLAQTLNATPATAKDGYGGEVSFYKVPCSARVGLPPVKLSLGRWGEEANVTLEGKDLVRLGQDENQQECHLRIAGWETQTWILGGAFMSRLTAAVFNLERRFVALSL